MGYRLKVIGLLLVCAGMACAQPRLRVREYYLGVHGGVTAGSMIFSPSVDNMKPITNACVLGGNGGLMFRYAGHKYCAVQVELNYIHRGWAEKNDAGRYSRELHYIEMPLLMHLNFGKEQWRGFFNLGPQIGYCVQENGGQGTQISTTTAQYGAIDHRFDWGLATGVGFYCRTRHAGVYQLEARFDFSLGGLFSTSLLDHFNMANPMDLSLNLAWLWEIKPRQKAKPKTKTIIDRALPERP